MDLFIKISLTEHNFKLRILFRTKNTRSVQNYNGKYETRARMFSQTLVNGNLRPKQGPPGFRKLITIKCGNKQYGTRARVLSLTLEHGNRKNEIRQKDRQKVKREHGRK